MTRDEVIAMAREAGFQDGWLELWSGNFLHFAALATAQAVAAEREACAKAAASFYSKPWSHAAGAAHVCDMVSSSIAAAIRARGEK